MSFPDVFELKVGGPLEVGIQWREDGEVKRALCPFTMSVTRCLQGMCVYKKGDVIHDVFRKEWDKRPAPRRLIQQSNSKCFDDVNNVAEYQKYGNELLDPRFAVLHQEEGW